MSTQITKPEQIRANHLAVINDKTIEMFHLYVLNPKLLDDLRHIGYMPIHRPENSTNVIKNDPRIVIGV